MYRNTLKMKRGGESQLKNTLISEYSQHIRDWYWTTYHTLYYACFDYWQEGSMFWVSEESEV